ncbi:hypothetical protein SELMODRAFT_232427 [Selaginella moellendorffii]|uniref:mannan endo-1,4-beta-mannosidase n=1 Tax=Selaginella moellendorffii TaxID=88036 RepID=D8RV06_SELML|nr:mannan endo-1,4-beta-mannosidase 7 [Selaginella moellendorffii]EFJ23690.1 hypothetical protein SELMODRAFT_232427 [Selaginella moellendorffii]|eukprot:XP_002974905.1 mannan endo-1,4-beta-mannosidase 7 [Selaginella moellendorffii]
MAAFFYFVVVVVGVACFFQASVVVSGDRFCGQGGDQVSYVRARGSEFVLDDRPLFINGFNAYWVTYYSFELVTRPHVSSLFRDASALGLNVARVWAFNDGGYHAIQATPGAYNEEAFQGLDFVIAEAQSYGLMLILSLSNNYNSYGGKPQYAQWAQEAGHSVESEDDFFKHSVIKGYYKNYVKAVLTRVNTITGVAYRDDPTIFAWELINEPRCSSDPSGDTLQAWIEEMSAFVKSLDSNHMLEVGLEGFYCSSDLQRAGLGSWSSDLGTDFIRNNAIPSIDFATVHSYPDLWLPDEDFEVQLSFLVQWIQNHIEDAAVRLNKPVLFAEFGKSNRTRGFVVEQRDRFFAATYETIFSSFPAAAAGGLLWQLVTEEIGDAIDDGYQIVPSRNPSTVTVISTQSQRVSIMNSRRS